MRADFFDQYRGPSTCRGLVDSLDDFRRPGFDPACIDPAIRSFYEQTERWGMRMAVSWRPGWRLPGRLYRLLSSRLGQANFPAAGGDQHTMVRSRIVPLDPTADGRPGARGSVRTFDGGRETMYLAAYATCRRLQTPYLSLAFPVPAANLTVTLRLEALPSSASAAGILLTSHREGRSDEGFHLVVRGRALRLPIAETICVWPVGHPDAPAALWLAPGVSAAATGRHTLEVLGQPVLDIDYTIFQLPDPSTATALTSAATPTPDVPRAVP